MKRNWLRLRLRASSRFEPRGRSAPPARWRPDADRRAQAFAEQWCHSCRLVASAAGERNRRVRRPSRQKWRAAGCKQRVVSNEDAHGRMPGFLSQPEARSRALDRAAGLIRRRRRRSRARGRGGSGWRDHACKPAGRGPSGDVEKTAPASIIAAPSRWTRRGEAACHSTLEARQVDHRGTILSSRSSRRPIG